MTFYIQCIFFHQWTKWRTVMVKDDEIAVPLGIEKRFCERCGKIQIRQIK